MAATDFAIGLARTLREVVRPLESALQNPDAVRVLLLEHGWHLADDGVETAAAVLAERLGLDARLGALIVALDEVVGLDGLSADDATRVLDAAIDLLAAIRDTDSTPTGGPAPFDRPEFWQSFPTELVQTLVAAYLQRRRPALYAPLLLAGVVDRVSVPADPTIGRAAYTRTDLRWDRLRTAITDPAALMREVYGWGTALEHEKLTERLSLACYAFGIPTSRRLAHHPLLDDFYAADNPVLERLWEVRAPLVADREIDGDYLELGIALLPIPPSGEPAGAPNGLLLGLYAEGEFGAEIPVGGPFLLELAGGFAADAALGVELRPGAVEARVTETGSTVDASATLLGKPVTPWLPIGRDDGPHVALPDLAFGVEVRGEASDPELRLRLATTKLEVVIDLDEGDGFMHALLGREPQTFASPMALVWSSKTGLTFEGSGSLAIDLPVNRSIGGIRVLVLSLGIGTAQSATTFSAAVTATAHLGPILVAVQGIGIELRLESADDGAFGGINPSFGFKPPDGIGLEIDAGPVQGGGFLRCDAERGEYAGTLELQLGKIGVKAIGLLSTDPEPWNLVLLLYAQIPPVQLGFGFTLEGIGGFLALQRGVDIDALVAGMKTGAFDDLLFPADPIGDAPRIIARMRTLFPVRRGTITVGPMVDVHWGKPLIITARLAILLQLDNALSGGSVKLTRVVVIGQLRAVAGPTEENPTARVLILIIDVLGFWDLAEKRYGVLARLRDSSVAGIDLTGSLGIWGEYGDHPRFILAAGGFNARYRDIPAQLGGVLDRLSASFSVGRFDFALTGYFAITPATIQAGLNLRATAKIGPVGLEGEIGFDVLIYRRPRTHFIADFRIRAAVTYRGHSLAGVKVTGTIEGPGRWHVVGKVSFSILWWDISKSFDESWGDPPPKITERVDVRALLAAELGKPENWSAQPPAGTAAMVTLAPRRGDTGIRAHPLGRFVFAQQVAPLGLTLEKFGDAEVTGPDFFEIEAVTIGGRPISDAAPAASRRPVREHFARSQFLEMAEEDRLTRPAYEEMDAGVEFSSTAYEISTNEVRADLEYETSYLDLQTGQTTPEPATEVPTAGHDSDLLQRLGQYGSAGRAPYRFSETAAALRLPLAVTAPRVAAADRGTLSVVELDQPPSTAQMVVEQRIRRAGVTGAQVVESFELVGLQP